MCVVVQSSSAHSRGALKQRLYPCQQHSLQAANKYPVSASWQESRKGKHAKTYNPCPSVCQNCRLTNLCSRRSAITTNPHTARMVPCCSKTAFWPAPVQCTIGNTHVAPKDSCGGRHLRPQFLWLCNAYEPHIASQHKSVCAPAQRACPAAGQLPARAPGSSAAANHSSIY